MTRQLVVETEVLAARADLADAAVERDEMQRRRGVVRIVTPRPVRGQQGIAREEVLDVREHQLLVLLLVIHPERGDREQTFVLGPHAEQLLHVLVDVLAILQHFSDGRARQQSALRPLVHAADGLIVGVEEVFEIRMKRAIAGQQGFEQELLDRTSWCARGATSSGSRPACSARRNLPSAGVRRSRARRDERAKSERRALLLDGLREALEPVAGPPSGLLRLAFRAENEAPPFHSPNACNREKLPKGMGRGACRAGPGRPAVVILVVRSLRGGSFRGCVRGRCSEPLICDGWWQVLVPPVG